MSDLIDSLRYHAEKSECGDTNVNECLHDAADLIKKLQSHVVRLREALDIIRQIANHQPQDKVFFKIAIDALEATPQQPLSERDAEVARKAFIAGYELSESAMEGQFIRAHNVDGFANKYAERVKRGDV